MCCQLKIYGNIAAYFSSNSSKISYFPVFPTLPKFGVFPRTVITGNYHWEFPPPVFTGQPCHWFITPVSVGPLSFENLEAASSAVFAGRKSQSSKLTGASSKFVSSKPSFPPVKNVGSKKLLPGNLVFTEIIVLLI